MSKGSFVSPEQRARLRGSIEPLARAMARAGLTPNMLTLIGFGIAAAGGVLAGLEIWLLAGIVATSGAAFDMFDGAVARVTGTVSKFGAFMDSTFDRWGEGVVYVGIVIGCSRAEYDLGAWLAAGALVSAFMVSYVRARGESLGFASGTGIAAVGFAPREVRTVILAVGLIGAGLTGGVAGDGSATGNLVLAGSLALIALLATITVIQRVLYVRAQATRQSTQSEGDR